MRPERRRPGRPFRRKHLPEDRTLLPFEPVDDDAVSAVAEIERRLTDVGRRARAELGDAERPDATFTAALRERLVVQLPAGAATEPAAAAHDGVVPGWVVAPAAEATSRRGITAPTVPSDLAAGFVGFVPTAPMAGAGRPQRVVGRLAWIGPRLSTPPRWAVAMVAAAFVAAALGFGPGRSFFTGPAPSHVTDVAGAALLRGGNQIALVDGAELQPGDEVRVAVDGHATLVLGGSLARLAGGAAVIVRTLAADRIVLDQLAGRVYHRVSVPAGGSYAVSTAGLTWMARGTAFDLDRTAIAAGTRLTLLAIQHSVVVDGPGISATIAEGRRAEIVLGGLSSAPDLTVGVPTSDQLHDPWLAANAALDLAAGFDPGILVALLATEPPSTSAPTASPEPTPVGPTSEPSLDPSTSPEPTSPATTSPSPIDTPRPTPMETPRPTPKPIAALGLNAKACPGGTLLDWSTAPAAGFHHYKTYWSPSAAFGGSAIVDGSATTNHLATSAVDAGTVDPRWYRTYAYDAGGHVIAKSPTRGATGLGGPADLGTLTIGPDGPGKSSFSWPDMAIPAGCYAFTKLVYSAGTEPSYGEPGTELLWWTSDQAIHALPSEPTPSGTWWFRVQVIVETDLGRLVVAQTAPVQYFVP